MNLSPADELSLIQRYKTGDRHAGQRLLEAHEGLIYRKVRRYCGMGVDADDLLQEGRLGFLHGVTLFDPTIGVKLITYAGGWARCYAHNYLEEHCSDIRVPAFVQQAAMRRRRGGPPSARTSSHRSGIRCAEDPLLAVERPLSLELNVWHADSIKQKTIGGALPDRAPLADDVIADHQEAALCQRAVERLLGGLAEHESDIIRRRIMHDETESLARVGATLGLSRERVRQIEEKALRKLRARLVKAGITDANSGATPIDDGHAKEWRWKPPVLRRSGARSAWTPSVAAATLPCRRPVP